MEFGGAAEARVTVVAAAAVNAVMAMPAAAVAQRCFSVEMAKAGKAPFFHPPAYRVS